MLEFLGIIWWEKGGGSEKVFIAFLNSIDVWVLSISCAVNVSKNEGELEAFRMI